jgi:hypothetical protein
MAVVGLVRAGQVSLVWHPNVACAWQLSSRVSFSTVVYCLTYIPDDEDSLVCWFLVYLFSLWHEELH